MAPSQHKRPRTTGSAERQGRAASSSSYGSRSGSSQPNASLNSGRHRGKVEYETSDRQPPPRPNMNAPEDLRLSDREAFVIKGDDFGNYTSSTIVYAKLCKDLFEDKIHSTNGLNDCMEEYRGQKNYHSNACVLAYRSLKHQGKLIKKPLSPGEDRIYHDYPFGDSEHYEWLPSK
ncbi:MAG: hypothetical protein M1828_005511 [Chrysothrix sp. TS-e1954]|nr:MAG: hypothetical protein M1828_005511 [Chrysothrix sp. TS-e1954]